MSASAQARRLQGMGAYLHALDARLMDNVPPRWAIGLPSAVRELAWFGIKEARACLFAGLFFAAVFAMPRAGLFGIPRYDLLLVYALVVQLWMLRAQLETRDEFRAICLFHAVGFCLEVFKTAMGSWSYPDVAYTKLFGVPLFSGFMYASVGSYIIQAWRLFDLRIRHHPPYWMAVAAALAIYLNFFTHHWLGDYRWYIAALVLGLYARTSVLFRPLDQVRKMPLLLAFVLIGFFLWLAENISTFYGIWSYPNQMGAWSRVHWGKWSSWSLLVIMTFTIVAGLKHVKASIHVPPE